MFLARKISEAKWRTSQEPEWSDGEIPADAVTIDLRTRENTLSFWRYGDGSESEVEEAALAMAASGDHIETVVMVWLSEEDPGAKGATEGPLTLMSEGTANEGQSGLTKTQLPFRVSRNLAIYALVLRTAIKASS